MCLGGVAAPWSAAVRLLQADDPAADLATHFKYYMYKLTYLRMAPNAQLCNCETFKRPPLSDNL